MKLILSDEEYSLLIKKWVRSSFAATEFFDKYEEILPVDILEKAYNKKVEISYYYGKLVVNSIRKSDIK